MAGVRVDAHVKVLDERVVHRAKRRGLDALVYAPHFSRLPEIRARAERFSDEDLLVVPAREVFTGDWRNRKHVLALALEVPVPDFVTLGRAMAEFDRQDAVVLAPHPEFATVSLETTDLERYGDQIHGVEVYNPKHWSGHNERAAELAEAFDIPAFGSSYAHLRGTVGEGWTAFETALESRDAIVEAFRERRSRGVYHRSGLGHRLRRAAEFSHLFYENGLSKASLLLKGVKPTNPYHPAYDGRFVDDAVYRRPQVRTFNDR